MVRFPFVLSGDLRIAWSQTHKQGGGGGGGGSWGLSKLQIPRVGRVVNKVNTLNKNIIFIAQQFFKTLRKIKGTSISNCDFLKVYTFCFGRGENITRLGRHL
jgi:hypothetical protein